MRKKTKFRKVKWIVWDQVYCIRSGTLISWFHSAVFCPFVFCGYLWIWLFISDPTPWSSWLQLIVLGLTPHQSQASQVSLSSWVSLMTPENVKINRERKSLWWLKLTGVQLWSYCWALPSIVEEPISSSSWNLSHPYSSRSLDFFSLGFFEPTIILFT